MKVISAGIIPFKIENGVPMFFVGHAGGKYWEKKEFWMFLKGGVEKGETWPDAAIREFKEETGLSMEDCASHMLIPLGSVQQNPQKTVVAYGLHYPNIDPNKCHSNYADDGITLEVDKYQWMTFEKLRKITHHTHLVFYEKLIEMIKEDGNNC